MPHSADNTLANNNVIDSNNDIDINSASVCVNGENNNNSDPIKDIKSSIKHHSKKLLSPKFLLVCGIAVSGAFIIEGFLCFTFCSINVRSYILSLYYILFGALSIAAELKFKTVGKYIQILMTKMGRALWYFFLGTIALGSEWWAVFISVFLMILGILNAMAGCKGGGEEGNANNNRNSSNSSLSNNHNTNRYGINNGDDENSNSNFDFQAQQQPTQGPGPGHGYPVNGQSIAIEPNFTNNPSQVPFGVNANPNSGSAYSDY